jgi:hypothetical protein
MAYQDILIIYGNIGIEFPQFPINDTPIIINITPIIPNILIGAPKKMYDKIKVINFDAMYYCENETNVDNK